jgi:hypothetical protein
MFVTPDWLGLLVSQLTELCIKTNSFPLVLKAAYKRDQSSNHEHHCAQLDSFQYYLPFFRLSFIYLLYKLLKGLLLLHERILSLFYGDLFITFGVTDRKLII